MRTVMLKTNAKIVPAQTTLAHPGAKPGNYRDASIQIRQINNVPEEIKASELIKLFSRTADLTWLNNKPGRFEFDFSELREGKIIR